MLENNNAVESTRAYGDFTISSILPVFQKHAQYDLSFAPQTVVKYGECLMTFAKHVGNLDVREIKDTDITELKAKMSQRGVGPVRIAHIIFAMKSLLRYCQEDLNLKVLDYKRIKTPKRPKREVIFLSNEEIQQFVDSIKIKGYRGRVSMNGLRLRTLVEVLLGSGMRISEALSLNRDSIDFEKMEAKIVGKGNKERTVFFNPRSLEWVTYYLSKRTDSEPALFITSMNTRLLTRDVSNLFRKQVKRSGIDKKITPHILRHTMATNLLFNGCPISHVKEILGHADLQTTCRYYLGVDKRKAKEAHNQFLNFG